MWKEKTVSVVLPTYNERESIRAVVEDFFASGYVDEVIVINNNAAEGTDEEVKKTRARLIHESVQGYGAAIQRGLGEATGDLIIISEPDGTFVGRDVLKLLAYSDDFPVVFGTRTTKELIWQGANMGLFLRWGNWSVAKMLEFLFNTAVLTDVGCTMRLVSRKAVEKMQDQFRVRTSHFGPEMMVLTVLNGIRFIEIPVNYRRRVGSSAVTGSKIKAFGLGLRMIWLILSYRTRSLVRHSGPWQKKTQGKE